MEFKYDFMCPFLYWKSKESFVDLFRFYFFSIYKGFISVAQSKGGHKIPVLWHVNGAI